MAIAFDNDARISLGSTSYNVISNTNGILIAWVGESGTSGGVTAVSYGGNAMTRYNGYQPFGGADWYTLWYLFAPPTGSNLFVIVGDTTQAVVASYTGVSQTGFPDNVSTLQTSASATSVTCTLTPVASGCWGLLGAGLARTFVSINPGSIRGSSGSNVQYGDSNGTISGSSSMTITQTPANAIGAVMFSMAPFGASTTTVPFLSLLGVGV